MWKCASTKGGDTRSPPASISRAPRSASAGPTAAMRPCSMARSMPLRPSGKTALRITTSMASSGLFFPVGEFGFVADRVDFGDLVLHRALRVEDGLIVDRGTDFTQTKIEQQLGLQLAELLVHVFAAIALDRRQQALLDFFTEFDGHNENLIVAHVAAH